MSGLYKVLSFSIMGRYAYFSTGVEHKFWFSVQESSDILQFYGESNITYDDDNGNNYEHIWEAKYDRERLLHKLNRIQKEHDLPVIDWNQYPNTTEGTNKLRFELFGMNPSGNLKIMAFYLLGAVIYHQLLYTERLTCQYEV